MKIIIAGDYSPKYRLEEYIATKNYNAIFGDIKNLISESDYAIVNFESVIRGHNQRPITKVGSCLSCHQNSIDALKWLGVNVITLANNHCMDFGEDGLKRTLTNANEKKIYTVGAGLSKKDAERTLFLKNGSKNIAIINCCENEFSIVSDNRAGANPINLINQYSSIKYAKEIADYIIVITHGGHEHFQLPSIRMQDTYRHFIDLGADIVINHHQHCFSGYELYDGKPIFYGLGNFCFDEKVHVDPKLWFYGFMVELNISNNDCSFRLIPYSQCMDEPKISLIQDTDLFNDQLNRLNQIITDRSSLISKLDEYYSKNSKNILSIFEPYSNRLTKSLFFRGLLPSRIKKGTALSIMNRITCESHLDKLKYALAKKSNI